MASSIAGEKAPVASVFVAGSPESAKVAATIAALTLEPHPEGGYFVETDRDEYTVPNPFAKDAAADDATRNASTTIYYYLTPKSPQGNFHRNKGRTVHTLHSGRGRYVLIHADEQQAGRPARIETFVVGHDLAAGERLQWIVEGGKYKASFLLPDAGSSSSDGLLISETVVPGFDFRDHDFLPAGSLGDYVTPEQAKELGWLVRSE